jgi:hypothetical protein
MRHYFTVYIESESVASAQEAFDSVRECLDGHNNSGNLPDETSLDWDMDLEEDTESDAE